MTAKTRIISGTHATYNVNRGLFILRFYGQILDLDIVSAPIRCTPCVVTFSLIWRSL